MTNKRGFAISTLLYPAFVIIITIVVLLLVALVNASFSISKLTNEISGDISDNNTMKSLKNNLKDALTETNSNRDVKYSAIAGSVYPVLNNNENTTSWNGNFYTKTDGTEMAYVNNNKYCAYKLAGMSGIAIYNSGECLKKIADQTNCAEIEALVTSSGGFVITNSTATPVDKGALYQIDIISSITPNGYIISDSAPTTQENGMVWIKTALSTSIKIHSNNINQSIDSIYQYDGTNWNPVGAFQYYNSIWNYLGQSTFAYSYTGGYQVFTALVPGYYKFEAWGAQGGSSTNGAYTSGVVYLNTNTKIYIYVGQNLNGTEGYGTAIYGSTAYNGGGARAGKNGSAGGGATDFRYFSTTPSDTDLVWNSDLGLKSRIMVAAGAGGASGGNGSEQGGAGGALVGITGNQYSYFTPGYGGTQTSAGGGAVTATFGAGASGDPGKSYTSDYLFPWSGGAGGGGYYGGGGGQGEQTSNCAHGSGGGGGSSYISGYIGCVAIASSSSLAARTDSSNAICTSATAVNDITCSYHYSGLVFVNTKMIAGNASMPTHDGISTMTGNSGNGYAKITYYGSDIIKLNDYAYYSYTGSAQTFIVPDAGYYKFEAWGAQGGTYSTVAGGKGAYTIGTIYLNKNDYIYVYVGQSSSAKTITYNGGGSAGTGSDGGYTAGGGATDFRLTSGAWNNSTSLASRIMVAAGGAGSGYYFANLYGGSGGTLIGLIGNGAGAGTAHTLAIGGDQIAGGTSGISATTQGSFGIGGNSQASYSSGGGGGYYGGGAGGVSASYVSAGAGGSSYISGYTGCVAVTSSIDVTPKSGCTNGTTDINCSYHYSGKIFTNTNMIAGNASMPTHDGTSTMTGNSGNGYAKITYLGTTN